MSDSLPANSAAFQRLSELAQQARQPFNGTFELTRRCNLGCSFCYIRCPANDHAVRAEELSAAQWLRIMEDAHANGMVFGLLTGGEVFLRPDFFELWEPLTALGLMLTIYTNGTLITESVADRLAAAPPSRLGITLYGATAATYDGVTGVPGSYQRCLDGIGRLVSRGLRVALRTTLTRHNVHELEPMRELAHSFGAPFSSSWMLTERVDGQASPVDGCRLAHEAAFVLEAADRERRGLPPAPRTPLVAEHDNFYCAAGQSSFVIDASGAMHVCLDLRRPGARPLEVGFAAAWAETKAVVDGARELSAECAACDVRGACPRCPAASLMEVGDLTSPVPRLCDQARARVAWEADVV